jgi:ubiquinone/menaquinone biosynthesis C-methylase UbiE
VTPPDTEDCGQPRSGLPPSEPDDFDTAVARAYEATGAAWSGGPALVYDRLAVALVDASPVPLAGRTVLDVGAGTGAASLAAAAAGARVVPIDVAPAMVRANRAAPPALVGGIVGNAVALPVVTDAAGGLIAAFSFNHLPDPTQGFAEAVRACRPGSPVLVGAYAAQDDHPVKEAVERAAAEQGWEPEDWYVELRTDVFARLATVDGMREAAAVDGLAGEASVRRVPLPDLSPATLVGWRMGMAHIAPFLAAAGLEVRRRVTRRALELLGPAPPPLERAIVVYAGVVTA